MEVFPFQTRRSFGAWLLRCVCGMCNAWHVRIRTGPALMLMMDPVWDPVWDPGFCDPV